MHRHQKKANQVFFGRTIIFVAMLLLQVVMLMVLFSIFAKNVKYITAIMAVISTVLIIYIVNNNQNPAFKLAWIIPMQAIPVFGVLFYLFVQLQPASYKVSKKMKHIEEETASLNKQDPEVMDYLRKKHPHVANLANYNKKTCGLPISAAYQVDYFPLGEDMWDQMVKDLSQAKSFIFMEYFIIEKGIMWDKIEKILVEKAAQGVEVRVLYDGIGSISTLNPDFPKTLEAKGIECRVFAKAMPLFSTVQNNRDHRKITVIDGKIAYTGGVNLADEYINQKVKYGHWKDTAVRFDGPSVDGLTTLFLQLWHSKEGSPLYWPYLRHKEKLDFYENPPEGFCMPYGENPFDDYTIGRHIYLDLLYNATDYVHIMSPYLILDNELIEALIYAASRGVSVSIMAPHIPDKAYAYLLARSYYPELISGGVKIYEYIPGFVHAKSFVADGRHAVIGTTNLDYRSLYLHFECGVYLFDHPTIKYIEDDFNQNLTKCQLMTLEDCRQLPIMKKVLGKALRLIAPMM